MTATESRNSQPVPETVWPDGSRVSDWSKATGTAPGKRALESNRPLENQPCIEA